MKNKEQKEYWIPCPVCKELSDVKVYEDTVLPNIFSKCVTRERNTRTTRVKNKWKGCVVLGR